MFYHFGVVFIFMAVGIFFLVFSLFLSWLIHPKHPSPVKNAPYECGEKPVGMAWSRFNIRFYTFALAFIVFDVEVVFLFPWAVVFQKIGWIAFVEMGIFLVFLLFGLAYLWVNGDLEWVKPRKDGKFLQGT